MLGVDAVELTHAGGEIVFCRCDNEVVMIAPLATRVYPPIVAFTDLGKDRKPRQTVGIVAVDVLAPVTARGFVIQVTSQFEAKRAWYLCI